MQKSRMRRLLLVLGVLSRKIRRIQSSQSGPLHAATVANIQSAFRESYLSLSPVFCNLPWTNPIALQPQLLRQIP